MVTQDDWLKTKTTKEGMKEGRKLVIGVRVAVRQSGSIQTLMIHLQSDGLNKAQHEINEETTYSSSSQLANVLASNHAIQTTC